MPWVTLETTAPTRHRQLQTWVDDIARLAQPDTIHWCDGSAEESRPLVPVPPPPPGWARPPGAGGGVAAPKKGETAGGTPRTAPPTPPPPTPDRVRRHPPPRAARHDPLVRRGGRGMRPPLPA